MLLPATGDTATPPWLRFACIGVAALAVLAAAAILWSWRTSAQSGGAWIPLENDSFYHAYRIIAAAAGELPQFDARIHAPEGSLVPWPWGYDMFLGTALRLVQLAAPGLAPMSVLAWWPPLLLAINLVLVARIAAQLGLRPVVSVFAFACVALCPQILFRHAFGMLDHHGAELTCVLLALWSGLRWDRRASVGAAALHGALLAAALLVHNGLFVLQVFTLLVAGWRWLRRDDTTRATLPWCAGALVATTLLVLLPSQPFRDGEAEFFYLSWFHLLASAASGAALLTLARTRPDARGFALLAGVCIAGGAALLTLARVGFEFVSGDLEGLQAIGETISAWESIRRLGWREFASYYTLIVLLAPLAVAGLARAGWLGGRRHWLLAFAALGGAMFLMQSRFWPYGLVPLILCAAAALETALRRSPQTPPAQAAAAAIATVFALVLMPTALAAPPRGGSHWYAPLEPLLAPLAQACADADIVLADANYGHFITYHTPCRVVANNFIMTAQHLEKRRAVREWFALSPERYRARSDAPDLLLVDVPPALLRHFARTGQPPAALERRALARALLGEVPAGYVVLHEARLSRGAQEIVAARLLRRIAEKPGDAPRD